LTDPFGGVADPLGVTDPELFPLLEAESCESPMIFLGEARPLRIGLADPDFPSDLSPAKMMLDFWWSLVARGVAVIVGLGGATTFSGTAPFPLATFMSPKSLLKLLSTCFRGAETWASTGPKMLLDM